MRLVRSLKRRFGVSKTAQALEAEYPDIDEKGFRAALELCRPASMTSVERLYALYSAVRYVVAAGLPGAFVECGVWKGGSVMMMARALLELGVTDRDIHLFDTFAGMTAPTAEDVDIGGTSMQALAGRNGDLCLAPLDEVRANLAKTGYPPERFHFAQGDVLATLPARAPRRIALLRLDTDWYESTRHELEHLFPLLERRGVLLIDDYGHFQGARQAVDEYFARQKVNYFLHRVDYTARMLIKD